MREGFSERCAYKGGTRLFIMDEKSRRTKKQFVTVQLFLGNASNPGKLLVQVQEPLSKQRASTVLTNSMLERAKRLAPDTDVANCVELLEQFVADASKLPPNHIIAKALSSILRADLCRNGFSVSFDVENQEKLEKKAEASEKEKDKKKEFSGPREIKLRPGAGFLASNNSEEEGDVDAEILSAFSSTQRMRQQNRQLAKSLNTSRQVEDARIAANSSKRVVDRQKEELLENSVISRAHEDAAWQSLRKVHKENKKTKRENQQYKVMVNEALEAMDVSKQLDEESKREKVKHIRELARMKWVLFPFRNGGKWQKGAVIGPGPLPIRNLALMRKKSSSTILRDDNSSLFCTSNNNASTSTSNASSSTGSKWTQPRRPMEGGTEEASLSQKDRLQKAFDVIRELARTNDDYYLDFDGAFARLDRKGKGFVSRKDLEFMMGGLYLSEQDLDMLWEHFDRENRGFVEKDNLIWAFYNQRTLLKVAQHSDEARAFRSTVIERVVQQAAKSRLNQSVAVRVQLLGVRHLKQLPSDDLEVFCILSCCQVFEEQGEDVIVISDEKRSKNTQAVSSSSGSNNSHSATWKNNRGRLLFDRGTMQDRRRERLLVEVRARSRGAPSDAHSIFLGEIFYPLLDLEAATNHFTMEDDRQEEGDLYESKRPKQKWFELKNGDYKGQIALHVDLRLGEGEQDQDWMMAAFAETNTTYPQTEEEEEGDEKELDDDKRTMHMTDERVEAGRILDSLLGMKSTRKATTAEKSGGDRDRERVRELLTSLLR